MLSFRPKGGISDSANDRDVSTSLRFARHDRTTFILSTYLSTRLLGSWRGVGPGAGGRGVADARLGNVATAALRPRSGSGDGEHGQRRASTALPRGIRCLTRYSRILERCRRRRGAIAALLSSPSRWQNPWRPWSRIRYCWMPWVSPWPRRTWRCGGPNWPPWQA
jgi:hypothetical protein